MIKKAIVLLSGGLDSATALYWAKKNGYTCHCLLFKYGQRHVKELRSAVAVAKKARCPYTLLPIRLPWNTSSLIGKKYPIPNRQKADRRLPSTYVPGRNTIFISFALSFAETAHAATIIIGANAVDYSGYPDCRPKYYRRFNALLKQLGTNITITTPLIHLTKADIIALGSRLGVPYQLTWSCYTGGKKPCGTCDSCRFRARGFKQAGIQDPLIPPC